MAHPTHTAIGTWSGGRFMHFGAPIDDDRLIALFTPGPDIRTVITADVYGAGEPPIEGVSGRLLVDAVLERRPWAEVAWVPTLDDAEAWARATLRAEDLLLTVGAGDVWRLGRSLVDDEDAAS